MVSPRAGAWWRREPLVGFSVLGVLLFIVHGLLGGELVAGEAPVVVDAGLVEAVARRHRTAHGTWPDRPTLAAAVEAEVDGALLRREARALGLDRTDPIVQQRLGQLGAFAVEGGAVSAEPPGDEVLGAWLDEHADRYRTPPRLAFEHRFFREAPAPQTVADALGQLEADPGAMLGAPFLDGLVQPAQDARRLDGRFGSGWFEALSELPVDTWHGPVRSRLGWHLVRVTSVEPPSVPPLETVRTRVTLDWLAARREAARTEALERLREATPVRVDVDLGAVLARLSDEEGAP